MRFCVLLMMASMAGAETGSLTIHMILHAVGEERYEVAPFEGGLKLHTTFEYSDRGNKRTKKTRAFSPELNGKHKSMKDIKQSHESERQDQLAKILARHDPKLVNKSFNTYLHDLPGLLDRGEEGNMVAYVKGTQIAIAPTPAKLRAILSERKLEDAEGLFTRRITATDVEDYALKR